MSSRPKVGIGVFIVNEEKTKILVEKRKKEQLYGLPGGKLEYGESFSQCSKREVYEETGLDIKDEERYEMLCTFNCIDKPMNYHWIEIFTKLKISAEEEKQIYNKETEKCDGWSWVSLEELLKEKDALFSGLKKFFEKYKINSIDDIFNLKTI
jgi:8-oxo-dGTP diphosphatase